MLDSNQLPLLTQQLGSAQRIVVLLGPAATPEMLGCATALAQTLEQAGKQLTSCWVQPIARTGLPLVGDERFVTDVGNKDLQISFPYDEQRIDKVSYAIDEQSQTFQLTVQPKPGVSPLDSSLVTFSYVGAEAECVFTFGLTNLTDAAHIYQANEELFASATLVSFHTCVPPYATVGIDVSAVGSYPEAVTQFIQELQLPLSADAASNLLVCIESSTNHFQSLSATAGTFEVVAALLRAGARRVHWQKTTTVMAPQTERPGAPPAGQPTTAFGVPQAERQMEQTDMPLAEDTRTSAKKGKRVLRPSLPFENSTAG